MKNSQRPIKITNKKQEIKLTDALFSNCISLLIAETKI